jgi:hypothetical protein
VQRESLPHNPFFRLPEVGGVEGTPSTNRNFEPFTCFLLAFFGELGSQDRQVKGRKRGVLEGQKPLQNPPLCQRAFA